MLLLSPVLIWVCGKVFYVLLLICGVELYIYAVAMQTM